MVMYNFSGCELNDINLVSCGYEKCTPDKIVGPQKWLGTLIHYVEDGKGFLQKKGKTYSLEKGDVFVINFGETVKYYPDENDPWIYRWICFSGALVSEFSNLPAVFKYDGAIFREICDICASDSITANKGILISSVILRWYSELYPLMNKSSNVILDIKKYIDNNYMYSITVNRIAKQMNMSRSYLAKSFKEHSGFSIHEYLTFVRMKKAKYYLEAKKNVSETAYLCGYTEPSNFSRMFKKFFGVSPQYYRESQSE